MPQWEYRVMPLPPWGAESVNLLNAAGTEGWELVGFPNPFFAVFKRPLQQLAFKAEVKWKLSGTDMALVP